MHSRKTHLLVSIATSLLPAAVMADALPSFQGLGDLPGGEFQSEAYGVSSDGSVVVGKSNNGLLSGSSGDEAFRWTAADGMVGLGDLPGGFFDSGGRCISADGAVIAGYGHGSATHVAIRWTLEDGMMELESSPGEINGGFPKAMSADGGVIVGGGWRAMSSLMEPFLWTESGGMVGLDPMPGASGDVAAYGVSGDGAIVVGQGRTSPFSTEAFRWTEEAGMVTLERLSGSSQNAAANAISSDGEVIVGGSAGHPFRWTAAEGIVALGGSGAASAVSSDGSVIVGYSSIGAFVWDETSGRRDLYGLLSNDFGLDLTGWTLSSARGVSGDGLTIVGTGINPDGNTEGWIATIPEPTSLALLVLGIMISRPRRRIEHR